MSTRSFIGIENSDGSIDFAYCHSDGYPSGVGKELMLMNRDQAWDLIAAGDMSSIGDPYSTWDEDCPFRGEEYPFRTTSNLNTYMDELYRSDCEYAYVINKQGIWNFLDSDGILWNLSEELNKL